MLIKRRAAGKEFPRVFLTLVLFLFLYALVPAAAMGNSKNIVTIKDGLMNAELSSVPLKTVLQNIGLGSNLEYKGEKDFLNEKITIRFENLSVVNGLKRLLSKFNYSITYHSDGTPASVYIFGIKGESRGNTGPFMADRSSQYKDDEDKNIRTPTSTADQAEPGQFVTHTVPLKTLERAIKVPAANRDKSLDPGLRERGRP